MAVARRMPWRALMRVWRWIHKTPWRYRGERYCCVSLDEALTLPWPRAFASSRCRPVRADHLRRRTTNCSLVARNHRLMPSAGSTRAPIRHQLPCVRKPLILHGGFRQRPPGVHRSCGVSLAMPSSQILVQRWNSSLSKPSALLPIQPWILKVRQMPWR